MEIGLLKLIVGLLMLLCVAYMIIREARKPKPNAIGWRHPENGGGIELFKHKPGIHRPYSFKYAWWRLVSLPVWLWYEERIDTLGKAGKVTVKEYVWKPYEPKAVGPTPSELWDDSDWECAKRFETTKSPLVEAIKVGMGVAMVAICVVGIIMVYDMLRKGGTPI